MKPWKRGILLAILVLGAPWLCTGGLVVHSYWFLPSNSYNNEFKPYVLAEVQCPRVTYGIPFLYQYYGDRPPFGISLTYITHNVVEEPRIAIDRLIIKFPEGTETELANRFQGILVPRADEHWYIDDNHVLQKKPGLRCEVTIEDCVPARMSFTLHIKGRLLSQGRSVETFEEDWRFTPNYKTHTYFTWHWLLLWE